MLAWLAAIHWAAVLQIILIDILLGGDNAVVIALACRNLPAKQRAKGIFWGAAGAIVLRVILITFAVALLDLPLIKMIGGALLIWIGVKLIAPAEEDGHENLQASDKLWAAVKTIIVADFVMSLDNVIAIAGAVEQSPEGHRTALIIFGLLVSVPFIVYGSQLVLKLLDRFPIIVLGGGALLGWIAGSLMVGDPVAALYVPAEDWVKWVAGVTGAAVVVVVAKWVAWRRTPPTGAAR
ncbi:MAG: TerC family protein [Burkholderiaceae bacterium]